MATHKSWEIRITQVPTDVRKDLINIAKNSGISLTNLLKPKLREIRDSYPEHMRQEKSKD